MSSVCLYSDTVFNYLVTHWFISTGLSFISLLDKCLGKAHYFSYYLLFSGYFHILLLHTVQACSENNITVFLGRFIRLSSVQCLSNTLTYPSSITLTTELGAQSDTDFSVQSLLSSTTDVQNRIIMQIFLRFRNFNPTVPSLSMVIPLIALGKYECICALLNGELLKSGY